MPSPSSSSSSSSSKEGSQRRSWRWKTLLISAQQRRPLKTNWKGCSHLSLPSRRPWCSLTPNSLAEARSSFCHRPSSGRHRSCWWHSGWSPNPKCSVLNILNKSLKELFQYFPHVEGLSKSREFLEDGFLLAYFSLWKFRIWLHIKVFFKGIYLLILLILVFLLN